MLPWQDNRDQRLGSLLPFRGHHILYTVATVRSFKKLVHVTPLVKSVSTYYKIPILYHGLKSFTRPDNYLCLKERLQHGTPCSPALATSLLLLGPWLFLFPLSEMICPLCFKGLVLPRFHILAQISLIPGKRP